jgi:hypothetical protein
MMSARLSIVLCVAALVVACGEKPQTTSEAVKKSDTQSWQGAENSYVTPGWKEGDRASWEEHLRTRTQAQNEYIKINN